MKIAILGDMHVGCRNSNQIIQQWQKRFFEECFWPKIDELGITRIVQVGDYFDNRKFINLNTMAFQREVFVRQAQKRGMFVNGIVGNHDIPYRHSLANNSPSQILNHEDGFAFYDTIQEFEWDGVNFTFMPWLCKENYEESIARIKQGGDVLIGHFEIKNFLMHAGAFSHDGLSKSDFKNWNQVYSGHYHAQSVQDNIHYIGTPYQMMWSDVFTKHGFWIFDTTDRSMEFIENPFRFFHRFVWENGCDQPIGDLKDAYVKINVKKKTDFEAFENFVDQINYHSPFDLKITETFEEFSSENVEDLIKISSTTDLIEDYIDNVVSLSNIEPIKKMMLEIYNESLHVEE